MSEMVERVIRGWLNVASDISDADLRASREPLTMRFETLDQFRNCIRAAIAAMREPTEAMLMAGRAVEMKEACAGDHAFDHPDEGGIWRAMIDKALED